MTREQRKSFRFKPRKKTFASFGSHLGQVGRILDISIDGLSFEFMSGEEVLVDSTHVDMFTLDEEYHLSGLPCLLVHQSAAPIPGLKEDPERGFMTRRCGLKYGRLSAAQWNRLAEFIQNNTSTELVPAAGQPSRDGGAGEKKK